MGALPGAARRIAWVFPGFGVGGAQVRLAALANHFGARCSHIVLSLNGDIACREQLAHGLDVSFPDAGHRPGHMAAATLQGLRVLRAHKPDLVVTSNWGAIEWAIGARLAGLSHIHTEDGFGPEEQTRQLPRRVLTRCAALRRSRVVLPSRTLLRIATETWRLPLAVLQYIPNGIDLARFTGAAPAVLPPGEGPVIGTIAALRPEKNIARLLHAFAILRATQPARLVIAGDGPERTALQALAHTLGIAGATCFAGHTAQAESWLAAFDVFALSSDTEQMPISLLEAMAAGLPCVCTDVGDVHGMLAEANSSFVVSTEASAVAAALQRMLQTDFRAIGTANRLKASRDFSQDRMFAAYGALLGVAS